MLVRQVAGDKLPTHHYNKIRTTAKVHGLNWEIDYVNFVRYRHVYWLFLTIFTVHPMQNTIDIDEREKIHTWEPSIAGLKRRGSTIAAMRNGFAMHTQKKENRQSVSK